MDQLKIYLAVVKKHQFWVLSGVMLLTTLVCWWLATGGLASQFLTRVSSIKSDISGTSIKPDHPNQAVIAKVNEQHALLKQGVFNAWKALYAEQKEKNPFPTKVLGEDFKKQFENLPQPPLPLGRLNSTLRERYQTFLSKDYIPGLAKMIDMRRPAETKEHANGAMGGNTPIPGGFRMPGGMPGGMPGAGMYGANQEEMVGLVEWTLSDYDRLVNRFTWTAVPSTLEVMLAQEDLWVYEALLRVIQSANKDAKTQANAAVKKIEAIEIGKDSRAAWGSGPASGAGLPPGAGLGVPLAGPGPGAGTSDDQNLFAARYVDESGQPLTLKAEYPYVDHPFAEFKMMSIHMRLVMDQRRLPKLLVDCANSNMPIEVRRVRIVKSPTSTLDLGSQMQKAGAPAGGPGGPTPGPGPGPGPMPGMGYRSGPATTGPTTPGAGSEDEISGGTDVPVDIYAIIYIYNPPDRQKLGTGAAATGNSADPAATPAPSQPTPPAIPGK